MFLKSQSLNIEEGLLFNKWLDNRFRRNQNVLVATTGSTGSGKSYCNLRQAELWYQYKFNKRFPVETHCSFSIGEIMKLLSSGKLVKGEIVILEEAGVNLGSLDFQQRISKLFTYVLQSFRSMNVGILFNLPILSMLNKSARFLLHSHFITSGIDYERERIKVKPFFHQINQQMGKIYPKYMRAKIKNKVIAVKRFEYSLPSIDIREAYESKKLKFVTGLTEDFSAELDKLDKENLRKLGRKSLTKVEQGVYDLLIEDIPVKEIAKIRQTSTANIYETRKRIENKGFRIDKPKKPLENQVLEVRKPVEEAV